MLDEDAVADIHNRQRQFMAWAAQAGHEHYPEWSEDRTQLRTVCRCGFAGRWVVRAEQLASAPLREAPKVEPGTMLWHLEQAAMQHLVDAHGLREEGVPVALRLLGHPDLVDPGTFVAVVNATLDD